MRLFVSAICLGAVTVLGGNLAVKKMTTIRDLVGFRLETKCDDTCSDDQKNQLTEAVKWANTAEANSCFAEEFSKHTKLDQKQWVIDNPGLPVKSNQEILIDLTTSPASTNSSMLQISKFNVFRRGEYRKMCADEDQAGNTRFKPACFDDEGVRGRTMTLAHELSHARGYEHSGNGYDGNEDTVPYVVQDVVCRCWSKLPGAPPVSKTDPDCDHIYR